MLTRFKTYKQVEFGKYDFWELFTIIITTKWTQN